MEKLLETLVPIIILVLEIIGLLIIVQGGITVTAKYIKSKFNYKDGSLGIEFAQSMSLGLQYLLAGEILATLTVEGMKDFWILAGITVLRIIIGLVLAWEIKNQ